MGRGTELKHLISRTILAGIFALLIFCCSERNGMCQAGNGPLVVTYGVVPEEIVIEGNARLEDGEDLSLVKQRALENAEGQALLDGVRPWVHPVVFSRETDYLLKALLPKKNEVLGPIELISEGWTETGIYMVTIRTGVRRDRLEDMLAGSLPPRGIVVMTLDRSEGKPLKRHILQGEVTALLKRKGYEVVDPRLFDVSSRRLFSLLRAGDREAPKFLGLYFLAATIVEGSLDAAYSQETSGIFSSWAQGSLRIYKRGGKEPVSVTVKGIKGFGGDRNRSVINALEKSAAVLSVKATKSISERQRKK
jgi:hypothetical protein